MSFSTSFRTGTCQVGCGPGAWSPSSESSAVLIELESDRKTDKGELKAYQHDSKTFKSDLKSLGVNYIEVPSQADVQYDSFGKTIRVKLPSGKSGVRISGLPTDITRSRVASTLSIITGLKVSESAVHLKDIDDCKQALAVVIIDDPSYAQLIIEKYESLPEDHGARITNIHMTPMLKWWQCDISGYQMFLSTVDITWVKQSNSVSFSFPEDGRGGRAKRAADILRHKVIRGRVPELCLYSASISGKPFIILYVSKLDTSTNITDLLRLLPSDCKPDDSHLYQSSQKYSDSKVALSIKKHLRRKGRLVDENSFQFISSADSDLVRATATFVNPQDAADVTTDLRNFEYHGEEIDLAFSVSHHPKIKYFVPKPVLKAIQTQLEALFTSKLSDIKQEVIITQDPVVSCSKYFGCLSIWTISLKKLARVKTEVERLLKGRIIRNGDAALWHNELLNPSFLPCLAWLSMSNNIHLIRFSEEHHIRVYGASREQYNEIQRILVDKLTEVSVNHYGGRRAEGCSFYQLTEEWMDETSIADKTLAVEATSTANLTSAAEAILTADKASTVGGPSTVEIFDCTICFTEAVKPILLKCKHVYCKDCLATLIENTDIAFLPFTCRGTDGKCGHKLSLEEISAIVPESTITKFLKDSYNHYKNSHPNEIISCRTPDCQEHFSRTKSEAIDICNTCLTPFCTACGLSPHKGMNCDENREEISSGQKALEKWASDRSNVKKCPSCSEILELNFGCNHMKCHCGEHFCWVCRQGFGKNENLDFGALSSKLTYDHLLTVHGGIGAGYRLENGFFLND